MKLKSTLLTQVLDNIPTPNKYSSAFINIKNVFELENQDNFTFPESITTSFKKLENKFNCFINNIPLIIIERYYNDYKSEYNQYVFLEYEENELSDLRVIDLFYLLEQFYQECFSLASFMLNYYNLEVKLNNDNLQNGGKRYI